MFLTDLFNLNKTCNHNAITPDMESGYCPDCGKLIKNEWYITRCACCGLKLKTVSVKGEIMPQHNYCTNCGGKEFIVEKLNKINFIDINFAVLQKKEINDTTKTTNTTQCWQEKTLSQPKLLVQYL
jgi:hypothetical protein